MSSGSAGSISVRYHQSAASTHSDAAIASGVSSGASRPAATRSARTSPGTRAGSHSVTAVRSSIGCGENGWRGARPNCQACPLRSIVMRGIANKDDNTPGSGMKMPWSESGPVLYSGTKYAFGAPLVKRFRTRSFDPGGLARDSVGWVSHSRARARLRRLPARRQHCEIPGPLDPQSSRAPRSVGIDSLAGRSFRLGEAGARQPLQPAVRPAGRARARRGRGTPQQPADGRPGGRRLPRWASWTAHRAASSTSPTCSS